MVWILFSPLGLALPSMLKSVPENFYHMPPLTPLPRKEAHRPWDDLCGRQSLAIHLKPDNWHALPLALSRLIGNNGEMVKRGLGTLNAWQVGLSHFVIKGHVKKKNNITVCQARWIESAPPISSTWLTNRLFFYYSTLPPMEYCQKCLANIMCSGKESSNDLSCNTAPER